MDPELLPGSGPGTRKIQNWIRIRNKTLLRIEQFILVNFIFLNQIIARELN